MIPSKYRFQICLAVTLIVFACIMITESATTGQRFQRRHRRMATISLPNTTPFGVRWTQQIIVPVLALINQTNTYLWFDFQYFTRVPTAANLNSLYTSFGRSMDNDGLYIDEEFFQEQIANKERRAIYQYIESFFNK